MPASRSSASTVAPVARAQKKKRILPLTLELTHSRERSAEREGGTSESESGRGARKGR
jgi:hypothetical protein